MSGFRLYFCGVFVMPNSRVGCRDWGAETEMSSTGHGSRLVWLALG